MKGFVQQLLLYALIEGKHAGRYDLNRIRSPAVAIDLIGEAVLRQNLGGIDLGYHLAEFVIRNVFFIGKKQNFMDTGGKDQYVAFNPF